MRDWLAGWLAGWLADLLVYGDPDLDAWGAGGFVAGQVPLQARVLRPALEPTRCTHPFHPKH